MRALAYACDDRKNPPAGVRLVPTSFAISFPAVLSPPTDLGSSQLFLLT